MKPSVENLIGPLTRATDTGMVKWEEDPTGGYLARFGANVVNVYRDPVFGLRILSENGNVVDWLDEDAPLESHEAVALLFDRADRQFRNVDEVVTDILRRLAEQERAAG